MHVSGAVAVADHAEHLTLPCMCRSSAYCAYLS